jgi:hypothetical protein
MTTTKIKLRNLLLDTTVDFVSFIELTDIAFSELNITDPKMWLMINFSKKSRSLLLDSQILEVIKQLHDLLPDNYLVAINGKTDGWIGDDIIYLGRANPSLDIFQSHPLANPFKIGVDGDRSEVIEKYRKWLFSKIKQKDNQVMQSLNNLKLAVKLKKHKKLACYCKPEPCHVDVVIKAVHWLLSQD